MMNRTTRLFLRRLASGSLVASVCAIGFASTGQAQSLGPLVQVTGADPFATCTKDNVHRQETAFGSVLYPNTPIEPWVAVDPQDTSRFLAGHQQDRWDDGGARGLVGVVSNDGGASWTNTIPQDVTRCTGGKDDRASDPWVAFANDGTAFFMSLVLNPAKPTTPFGARHGGMLMSKSTDHDKAAALKFLKRIMKKYGQPRSVVTDGLCSYPAAMKEIGNADRHEVGRRLNNRAENSHQPFRRRERAMQLFRSAKTLQKFSSIHAQVHNHFNQERHLVTREVYKQRRSAALVEWRGLAA
jgi:hypothetical protein